MRYARDVGLDELRRAFVVYAVAGLVLFAGGAALAYQQVGHVQDRFAVWIDRLGALGSRR